MSDLNNPTARAAHYIRRIAASDPVVSTPEGFATVVNIEDIPANATDEQRTLVLDLDDGTTIRLDISRYPRASQPGDDDASVESIQKLLTGNPWRASNIDPYDPIDVNDPLDPRNTPRS